MHGLSKIFYITRVNGSNRSSGGRKNVDMELSAESLDLFLGQTSVGEHTALLGDVRPVTLGTDLLKVLNEESTHILDTLGHGGAFLLPLSGEGGVVKNGGDNTSTIDGRARPEGTSTDLQLLDNILSLLGGVGDNRDNTSTFTVDTEVLGEGKSEGDVVAIFNELTESVSIVSDRAGAVTEVSSIEDDNMVLLLAELADLVPLLVSGINTSGVVSTGVEHEGGVVGGLVDIVHHTGEVEGGTSGVEVTVFRGVHTTVSENGVLVSPGGVGESNIVGDVAVVQELGKETERTRTRNSLSVSNNVLLLVVELLTPSELAGSVEEIRNTNQRRVFVILSTAESSFSLSDTRKNVRLYLIEKS